MRLMLVFFVACLSMAANDAQARREFTPRATPRVDSIVILEKGSFKAQVANGKRDDHALAGRPRTLAAVKLIKDTEIIRIKPGLFFGIRYVIRGAPLGARVPVKIVQRYPKAGLHNPQTQKTTFGFQRSALNSIGYPNYEGYHLGKTWEAVAGTWIFEIWYGGRKLAEQKFELVAK